MELASVLAGPLAGSFFAELGATVVKIENKNAAGDVTRSWKLPEEATNTAPSAYYHSANFGKQVLMLDLNNDLDYNLLLEQISDADIVLSNYQKVTAEKLRIDYDTLLLSNLNLIFMQLNAFSYEDPRPGYDLVMQAETGYISMCGDGEFLAKMPVAMIDILASHQIKEATLIALLHRLRTGNGGLYNVSLYKSALSGLVNQATNYLMEGHIAKPIGTRHPNIAPYGDTFKTADDKTIMLSIGSDAQFEKLCCIFNCDIPSHFIKNIDRLSHRNELNVFINEHGKKHNANFFTEQLDKKNIPFAFIKNMKEVFEDINATEAVLENDIEGSGGKYVSGIAFEFANL